MVDGIDSTMTVALIGTGLIEVDLTATAALKAGVLIAISIATDFNISAAATTAAASAAKADPEVVSHSTVEVTSAVANHSAAGIDPKEAVSTAVATTVVDPEVVAAPTMKADMVVVEAMVADRTVAATLAAIDKIK
jgi:hypothetical protein